MGQAPSDGLRHLQRERIRKNAPASRPRDGGGCKNLGGQVVIQALLNEKVFERGAITPKRCGERDRVKNAPSQRDSIIGGPETAIIL